MTRRSVLVVPAAMVVIVAAACGGGVEFAQDQGGECQAGVPARLQAHVTRTIPRDQRSYTQGFVLHDGALYESTGLRGESRLRVLDPGTGQVRASVDLEDDYFGEGLAIANGDELVQLTWTEGRAFRWALEDFRNDATPIGSFAYEGEGWGLTTLANGDLLMSDGSDTVVERDPGTFEVTGTHVVTRSGGPADALNELEWDGSHVWANRYQSNEILRIDPDCWTVTGVVDATELTRKAAALAKQGGIRIDVLNGIAFDPDSSRYLFTGKLWPVIFEVRLEPG